jgi:hypothetical protein
LSSELESNLVKSRKRVVDHGEVFTPKWLVEKMLDLVKNESLRIDSRVLEPACGSGNFLVEVLKRKLQTVDLNYSQNQFEKNHHALLALMCTYGIELLQDNAEECRENLLEIFAHYLKADSTSVIYRAGAKVLQVNIIQADSLAMKMPNGQSIEFPEWAYLTKGKFSRRDFSYDTLTQRSSHSGTLFDLMADNEIFIPVREYSRLTVEEIAEFVETRPSKSSGASK